MSIQLIDPRLGTLELRGKPFTVPSFTIGGRATRANVRNRALADGLRDDTQYGGGRAITVAVVLNEDRCAQPAETMQQLIDQLSPYMVARRRPILRWTLPGGGSPRQTTVRPEPLETPVTRSKHIGLVLQFVSDGEIVSPEQRTELIAPAEDTEEGRSYDLTYDRSYPASQAVGDRIVTQAGNERAHWIGAIFGDVTGPYIRINGTTVQFEEDYNVPAGSSIIIDTRERTMLLNGDPNDSVYHLTNFAEWTFDELLLEGGENQLRYGAEVLGTGTVMQMAYRDTWAG